MMQSTCFHIFRSETLDQWSWWFDLIFIDKDGNALKAASLIVASVIPFVIIIIIIIFVR